MALGNEWNFEVNRCPRNPHIVSCSSYGRFSLFSFADRAPQPVANELQQTLSEGHVENHIQQPVSLPVQPASYTQQPVSSVHHAVNQIQQPVLSVDSVANLQHSEVPSDASSLKQMPIQQTPSAHLKKTSGVSFAVSIENADLLKEMKTIRLSLYCVLVLKIHVHFIYTMYPACI